MNNYILDLLQRIGHPLSKKPQLSPHEHSVPTYGSKQQFPDNEDNSPALDKENLKFIQTVVGALLYYGCAVDNKLLVALGTIATQAAASTKQTKEAVTQLLNYVATYPNDAIIYRESGMQLAAHSDAGYLNVSKARSRAGTLYFSLQKCPHPTI